MINGFETKFYLINLKNCLKKTIFEKRDVKGGFKMFLIAFLSYKIFFVGFFNIKDISSFEFLRYNKPPWSADCAATDLNFSLCGGAWGENSSSTISISCFLVDFNLLEYGSSVVCCAKLNALFELNFWWVVFGGII